MSGGLNVNVHIDHNRVTEWCPTSSYKLATELELEEEESHSMEVRALLFMLISRPD